MISDRAPTQPSRDADVVVDASSLCLRVGLTTPAETRRVLATLIATLLDDGAPVTPPGGQRETGRGVMK